MKIHIVKNVIFVMFINGLDKGVNENHEPRLLALVFHVVHIVPPQLIAVAPILLLKVEDG